MLILRRSPQQAIGSSLIEVLISMVVMAVGLLGIAQLQIKSVRLNHRSFLATQAALLAANGFDKLRVNRPLASDPRPFIRDGSRYISRSARPPNKDCGPGGVEDCTPLEFARYDFDLWKQEVEASLPDGRATIERQGNLYTITLTWQQRRLRTTEDRTGTRQSMETTSMTFESII